MKSKFQFTLPRGERRPEADDGAGVSGFNSRSRVGSDEQAVLNKEIYARFNSRSRVGSDLAWADVRFDDRVSIHAPAWGATHPARGRRRRDEFQFTLPRGERLSSSRATSAPALFQFTLPRGERHLKDAFRAAAD